MLKTPFCLKWVTKITKNEQQKTVISAQTCVQCPPNPPLSLETFFFVPITDCSRKKGSINEVRATFISLNGVDLTLVPVCGRACHVGRLIWLEHKLHLIIVIISFSLHMTTEFNLRCKHRIWIPLMNLP